MMNAAIRKHVLRLLLTGGVATLLVSALVLLAPDANVRALPEYANRTHEACGTCHVSPGGAGPLTLTGLSWIASGRPDKVQGFKNVLIAPGVTDAQMLYEIACAACHGLKGEGLSASALVGFEFTPVFLRRVIVDGVEAYNMPGFEGRFTQGQLDALSKYVSDLSAARVTPLESYPLLPGVMACDFHGGPDRCGGN
jgi:mono/diheme cytochrome c family protein